MCSDPPAPARIVATSGVASGGLEVGGAAALEVAMDPGEDGATGLVALEDVHATPARTRTSAHDLRHAGKVPTKFDASSPCIDPSPETREDVVMSGPVGKVTAL